MGTGAYPCFIFDIILLAELDESLYSLLASSFLEKLEVVPIGDLGAVVGRHYRCISWIYGNQICEISSISKS
jgi:hypothetical protein